VKIYAHRGASGYAPENTITAISQALFEYPCDGIEIDVHLSKDKKLVVIHDETVDRTTNGQGQIKDLTYEELRKLSAWAKFGEKFKDEYIPTLDEVLSLVKKSGKEINIEIKAGSDKYPGIEEAVIEKIHEYRLSSKTLLSSFDHKAMLLSKEIDPKLRTGLLNRKKIENPTEYLRKHKADAMNYSYLALTPSQTKEIKNAGYEVNTYTPNTVFTLGYCIMCGADTLITNYPDKAYKIANK